MTAALGTSMSTALIERRYSKLTHYPAAGRGVIGCSGYLLLNRGKRQWYKHTMRAMVELGRNDLPRPISAEKLQAMLGPSAAFCSWDASNSTVTELMDRWPFLFSHALMGTKKKPSQ
jgi:hypothetical protein